MDAVPQLNASANMGSGDGPLFSVWASVSDDCPASPINWCHLGRNVLGGMIHTPLHIVEGPVPIEYGKAIGFSHMKSFRPPSPHHQSELKKAKQSHKVAYWSCGMEGREK